MTKTQPTSYGALIIATAKRLAKSQAQDWPGMPLTQVEVAFRDELHALIRDGYVTIVDRPRSHRPGTVSYIVAR